MKTVIREIEYRNKKIKLSLPTKDKVSTTFRDILFLENSLKYIDPGTTIIDCGAYNGNHSLYWSLFSQCSEILAFEAFPDTYSVLCETLNLNNCKNVIAKPVLLGEQKQKMACVTMLRALSSTTFFPKKDGKFESEKLDDHTCNIEKISFVKIDVEGMELDILKGAKRMLQKHHPTLHIEAHVKINKDIGKTVVKWLTQFGYKEKRDLFLMIRKKHPHYKNYKLKRRYEF